MFEPDVDWDSNSGSGSDVTALTDVVVPAAPAVPEGEEGAAAAPPTAILAAPIEGPNAEQRALIAKMHGNAVDARRNREQRLQQITLFSFHDISRGIFLRPSTNWRT